MTYELFGCRRVRARRAPLTALAAAACALSATRAASPLLAQDTTARPGVRIGLTYAPGTKPGVAVVPVAGPAGDSVRAIIERDLDYSDRITIVGPAAASAALGAASGGATAAAPNYALLARLGAAAVVRAAYSPAGLRVTLYDVGGRRVAETRDFPLPARALESQWRLALHAISDVVEEWVTGTRGIAATRILYVSDGRVRVVDSDGANDHPVSERGPALSPAWHPGGRLVAYSTFGARGTQIVLRDIAANGAARTLAGAVGGLNITPEFSPDGSTIVYAHGDENGTDLVAASVDGGGAGARRVTVGRGTDNVSPTFSPDGRRVAFTSGRPGHPEVYITDVDGTNAELLTPYSFGDQSYRSNPDWSPDGRVIAFQSQLAGRFQVMTINLRDRSIKQLTSEGGNEDPSWAPDSRHLVFASTRGGMKQLWVLDAESGRARQLTRAAAPARLPAWSPVLARAQ